MEPSPITPEVSDRITKHMNKDHRASLLSYAKYYAGIRNAIDAKMLSITPQAMELKVDGELVRIKFDHTLKDSSDAHRTLVAMLEALPSRHE